MYLKLLPLSDEQAVIDMGEKSCGSDDCESVATCPSGYAPTECVVETGTLLIENLQNKIIQDQF